MENILQNKRGGKRQTGRHRRQRKKETEEKVKATAANQTNYNQVVSDILRLNAQSENVNFPSSFLMMPKTFLLY